MALEFKLDEAMVREAMQEALITALNPETRDKLVADAIRSLLSGTWQNPSEVERVFKSAAAEVARKLAEAEFEKPENVERIRSIVNEGIEKAISGDARVKLVEKMGDLVARGIYGDRY